MRSAPLAAGDAAAAPVAACSPSKAPSKPPSAGHTWRDLVLSGAGNQTDDSAEELESKPAFRSFLPLPKMLPFLEPTVLPSLEPTVLPSLEPKMLPSLEPKTLPSLEPKTLPSLEPKMLPSLEPKMLPYLEPKMLPYLEPKMLPSLEPKMLPSLEPKMLPSLEPKTLLSLDPDWRRSTSKRITVTTPGFSDNRSASNTAEVVKIFRNMKSRLAFLVRTNVHTVAAYLLQHVVVRSVGELHATSQQ